MDLEASCKEKLSSFRIKELKDVLTQLGLSKQGKKQDLVERVLTLVSDGQAARLWSKKNTLAREDVAKLVDDTYRKMQVSGASDLASKGQVSSDTKVKGEPEDSFRQEVKVRCVCGSSLETDSMIQCEDPRCHVWEHVGCVIVPEKSMDANPPLPEIFYCEVCRLTRADPFLVTVAHPLCPVRFTPTTISSDGTTPMQSVERTFQITRSDKDLLAKQEYDVQAWCMLLNDKVVFRMQWPQVAELQINGMLVRPISRPGSQLLGANGRDDGPTIKPYIRDGINRIILSGGDSRRFCFGVRLVKRRTLQQVLNLIPEETKGETFEDALARVRRCIGGGGGDDNADSDSDIEVVADFFGVNLRCPMSGSRIKVAGRFLPCVHMGGFDLEVFVELNQRSRKAGFLSLSKHLWQCPICLKNYSVEHVIVDPYFNRITSKMKHCDEDVTEIEVKPDGSWRVKSKKERELSQWHLPDGSLCPSADEVKRKMETLIPVKQEGFSDGPTPLKLGIRKNRNGVWEVRKPNTNGFSSSNKVGYQDKNIVPMSSSATGSGRDGDDASVSQDAIGSFDFGTNGIELDSISMNVDSSYNIPDRNQAGEDVNNDVIVLSDSDEDNDVVITTPGPSYSGCRTDGGVNFPLNPSGIINSYNEDPHTMAGGSSRLGGFNDDDEFVTPLWPFPSETPEAPLFPLFGSDADVSEGLLGLHHHGGPLNCGPEINGDYTLAPETSMASEAVANDGGLVDNPLAFGRDDPSLQIFLPTKPDASAQNGFINQADMSNGIRSDDWISLRLGDSAGGNHGEATSANGLNSNQQMSTREGCMDATTETASLLLGMNDNNKAKRQRSDKPFSFPRQKRSVRPRMFLSIDSDSE
ncbi:unnamed protein product [Brassica oleracea]